MIQIEKITIKYFRSIYSLTLKNLNDISVLSGKNDCGKSNILRALNLFFNHETGWRTPLEFSADFNIHRLDEVRKESIKGKQFIQITVYFIRGQRYIKSLPPKFNVTKTWHRDSTVPQEKNSLRENNVPTKSLHRAQASLQRYLNKIRFEYMPAIKDRSFFNYSLGTLQDTILESEKYDSIDKVVSDLNKAVRVTAINLNNEFKSVVEIETDIQLPSDLSELFRAFKIMTGSESAMPLSARGDGIQARFLPSLLHYISGYSRNYYIWGFEEPENCLEHALATKLADTMSNTYAKDSQIIMTSHSPAFVYSEGNNSNTYRVYNDNSQKGTAVDLLDIHKDSKITNALYDEIGLLKLQQKHQEEYVAELERLKDVEDLYKKAISEKSPILLVEGESDVSILKNAWKALFPSSERPYRILSSDVSGVHDPNTRAGVGILAKALESCRDDLPFTIGLFDYDKEGISCFKLDNNFNDFDNNPYMKTHMNDHVAALIYHDIEGKEEYFIAKNMCIEFLFPEKYIIERRGGKGLVIEQKKSELNIEGLKTDIKDTTELYYRKITSGKIEFAKHVVPYFSDIAFVNFKIVFKQINKLFKEITN